MNCSPARAAAAATSSGDPEPSDRLVWTWSAPAAWRDAPVVAGSESERGGSGSRTKRKAAARTAAAMMRATCSIVADDAGSYSPAALRSASARSVFSQVKPSSVRPKCPNAAVFL